MHNPYTSIPLSACGSCSLGKRSEWRGAQETPLGSEQGALGPAWHRGRGAPGGVRRGRERESLSLIAQGPPSAAWTLCRTSDGPLSHTSGWWRHSGILVDSSGPGRGSRQPMGGGVDSGEGGHIIWSHGSLVEILMSVPIQASISKQPNHYLLLKMSLVSSKRFPVQVALDGNV